MTKEEAISVFYPDGTEGKFFNDGTTENVKKVPKSAQDDQGMVKRLADAIQRRNHFAQDAGGRLYIYTNGVYKPRASEYIKGEVKLGCIEWQRAGEWSSRLATEVIEFIRVDAPRLWERPPVDCVNVRNGLVRVADGVLIPHTPDHRSPVQLPIDYDPAATCPAIDRFASEVFPSDAIDLAYEVPGLLMVPDTSLQLAILLLGEGANGKSRWLALLVAFLGKSNTAGVALHKLEADKFSVARLIGKLANICPDLPSEHLVSTSTFKALTGGDTLTAEYKFRDSFDFVPFARLVFSANHPPRSADASHAFFRRWLVIPFGRTFATEEQIPADVLDARLSAPGELSGLLNKALAALRKIKERGLSQPESVKAAWGEFHATTDPLAVWLDRRTIDDPQSRVPKAALMTAYNTDCERSGRPVLSKRGFGLALRRIRPNLGDAQHTVGGRVQWCYVGIGLIDTTQDTQFTENNPDPSRDSRDSRDNLYPVIYRTERLDDHIEQDKAYPVNRVNPVNVGGNGCCPHDDLVEDETEHGTRVMCRQCGKFYGYKQKASQ